MAAKQSRSFLGVIYPDAQNYDCQEVLKKLSLVFQSYAYILHDMDTDSNGELKKPHYHWVGRRTPAPISTIANALGVPENSVEFCKSFRASIRYLSHLDDSDKYQYSVDAVQGNFPRRYFQGKVEESAFVASALDAIYSGKVRSIHDLQQFALQQEEWSSFRRNYSILKDALFEVLSQQEQGGWGGG